MSLDPATIRGAILAYLEQHAALLKPPVLEVGSRLPLAECTWANFRHLCAGEWVGVDMMPGTNVDVVLDADELTERWPEPYFGGAVLAEVLEHVVAPWRILRQVQEVLLPGSWVLIAVPSAWPQHNHPLDMWRFMPQGLTLCLRDAGFDPESIQILPWGEAKLFISDHGEPAKETIFPHHLFCCARKPESAAPALYESAHVEAEAVA